MLRSLLQSKSIDPENPLVHRNIVRFFREVEKEKANQVQEGKEKKELIYQVIEDHKNKLLGDSKSLVEFNDAFSKKHSHSIAHRYEFISYL
jgi:hypothetical protein